MWSLTTCRSPNLSMMEVIVPKEKISPGWNLVIIKNVGGAIANAESNAPAPT